MAGAARAGAATLAVTLQARPGVTVSAETMRCWLREVRWVWKRAKLVANDDDPHRDVVEPLHVKGPWKYQQSDIYHAPAVTEAVEKMAIEQTLAMAS